MPPSSPLPRSPQTQQPAEQHTAMPAKLFGQCQHQTTPKTRTSSPAQIPTRRSTPSSGLRLQTANRDVKRSQAYLCPLKCGVDACCCNVHLKRKTGGEAGLLPHPPSRCH
ncbi:hypothetical protein AMECASPLE_032072 [Ameca splendens]|uniref:Uncharacterized protein n=1 Tax=Ameca splendens TaxID=208324 RepID=A0ABV1ACU6_9TELE